MKTLKNIYKDLLNIDRIKEIIILASKGKKKRKSVMKVLNNIDYYAQETLKMLQDKTFYMSPSHHKTINEKGKDRELTISPFYPNRILDYIMVETLKPFIRKSMYEFCIGNVDKRGIHYGMKVVKRKVSKYKYFIKLDIRKFYPSLKVDTLYEYMQTKISDKDFLELCKCVVYSCNDLPIGSYYSQWFSNWFLQELDHMIKEKLAIPFYIRYVDDMLLMSNNKKKLKNAMYNIQRWLAQKGLTLKKYERVKIIKNEPIDFLGYRFYDNKTYLRLKNFKLINRKVNKFKRQKHLSVKQARSFISCFGWLRDIKNGYLFYKNKIKKILKLGMIKKVISNFDKRSLHYDS